MSSILLSQQGPRSKLDLIQTASLLLLFQVASRRPGEEKPGDVDSSVTL